MSSQLQYRFSIRRWERQDIRVFSTIIAVFLFIVSIPLFIIMFLGKVSEKILDKFEDIIELAGSDFIATRDKKGGINC